MMDKEEPYLTWSLEPPTSQEPRGITMADIEAAHKSIRQCGYLPDLEIVTREKYIRKAQNEIEQLYNRIKKEEEYGTNDVC